MSNDWAVVAGASGTIGSAVSTMLTGRGLRVLGLARAPDPGRGIRSVDLTDTDAVAAIGSEIDGDVRVIVQAAGPELGGGIRHVDPASVLAAMDTKVLGLLRIVRAVEHRLVRGSRIIAVTGHLGYDPVPASVGAGVANAALGALVRQLAAEYGPTGITSHAVAPGPVESPRLDRLIEHLATAGNVTTNDARQALLDGASVGRFATPDDVAWAVSTLLEDAAALANGSTLFLDGGRRTAIP
jgi:NAD(P)-dependent dehydrogenase (short-subunit alcohol dehydrogenase family)